MWDCLSQFPLPPGLKSPPGGHYNNMICYLLDNLEPGNSPKRKRSATMDSVVRKSPRVIQQNTAHRYQRWFLSAEFYMQRNKYKVHIFSYPNLVTRQIAKFDPVRVMLGWSKLEISDWQPWKISAVWQWNYLKNIYIYRYLSVWLNTIFYKS